MSDRGKEWFSERANSEKYAEAQTKWLLGFTAELRKQHMNPANMLRYSHGTSWVHPTLYDPSPQEMKEHGAELLIRLDDIKNNNLEAWIAGQVSLAEQLHHSFVSTMIGKVSECTDKTGNSVSAKEVGSNARAFLETYRKLELGVDRQGNVSQLHILVGADMQQKLIADLEAQPQSFKDEWEAVRKQKEKEALAREAERRARFRSSG